MFFIVLLLNVICSTLFQQFNVYYRNIDQIRSNSPEFMYGCLHYYVLDDIVKYDMANYVLSHQIILYCFRPLEKTQHDTFHFSNTHDRRFTFEELRTKNVSSQQLYSWMFRRDRWACSTRFSSFMPLWSVISPRRCYMPTVEIYGRYSMWW